MEGYTALNVDVSDIHTDSNYNFGSKFLPALEPKEVPNYQRDRYSDIAQASTLPPNLTVCKNGFVQAVVDAYNKHHNLIIRPDDIWGAILTQFFFYVNNHEEKFQGKFGEYKDNRRISICAGDFMPNSHFHHLLGSMFYKIDKNVVNSDMKRWILPKFSNPAFYNAWVTRIALSPTVNRNFKYTFGLYSGIPSITLVGTVNDWKIILQKLEKFKDLKLESWYHILQSIVQKLVDAKMGKVDLNFWRKIVTYHGLLDTSCISGWITAFCVFSEKGDWLQQLDVVANYAKLDPPLHFAKHRLKIDIDKIPPGFVEVAVRICDKGTMYDTVIFGGHLGTKVYEEEEITIQSTFGCDMAL